jgi:hypothetical protein
MDTLTMGDARYNPSGQLWQTIICREGELIRVGIIIYQQILRFLVILQGVRVFVQKEWTGIKIVKVYNI